MKKPIKVVNERRDLIINLLKEGITNVNEIAEKVNVSLPTVRRDLDYLYINGYIERYYGGAKISSNTSYVVNISRKDEIRNAISQKAASFINDNDTIFINSSRTAVNIINYITANNVTVITNNGRAISLDYKSNVNILLTGGEIRVPKYCMVGNVALSTISKIKADKCFLGCNGICSEVGLTTKNLAEVAINEQMIQNCDGNIFVVASNEKVGFHSNFISSPANKITHLITDNNADFDSLSKLEQQGVKVIQTQ